MDSQDFQLSFQRLMLLASLGVIFGWVGVASRAQRRGDDELDFTPSPCDPLSELERLFPTDRIERIKKKELRRYQLAQDKKWENWIEALSK